MYGRGSRTGVCGGPGKTRIDVLQTNLKNPKVEDWRDPVEDWETLRQGGRRLRPLRNFRNTNSD